MKSPRAKSRKSDARTAETELLALEGIERFARVLTLTGMSRERMSKAFRDACAHLPQSLFKPNPALERELMDAAHILTLWVSDPSYLDSSGSPLMIPLKGKQRSLETLSKRVNPNMDLDRAVKYLIRTGSVVKANRRYSVKYSSLTFARDPELAYAHGLQSVLNVLRTIENNATPHKNPRIWFESVAANGRFPARLVGAFDAKIKRLGMDFLRRMDADMQRSEQMLQPGEPTVRMKIGVYQCEEEHRKPIGGSIGRAKRPAKRRKQT